MGWWLCHIHKRWNKKVNEINKNNTYRSTVKHRSPFFENKSVITQHFGHTEAFKIYDVEDRKVLHSEVVDTNGRGHGALAGVLNALNADVLICGGIGGGAQTTLAAAGIRCR